MQTTPQRQKHNYTSELELKSLLIRIKNKRFNIGDTKENNKINKYIKWHNNLNNIRNKKNNTQKNILKNKIKDKIVELSEQTSIDDNSYEQFGNIILLMIKKILTKPSFSGYSYRDDFYSDAVYKILKYLHNFNHKLISQRTGTPVNAFAYISQYIHNSILFIINTKNDELKKIQEYSSLSNDREYNKSSYYIDEHTEVKEEIITLEKLDNTLYDYVHNLNVDDFDIVKVYYPHDYIISFDEYNLLKDSLKGKISVIKSKSKNV